MAERGEAGRRGPDVRSDCWVAVTPTSSNGIEIELTSKVESMYGDSIRALIPAVLGAVGLPDARVTVEDAGALPFVLAARLEASAKRARPDLEGSFRPEGGGASAGGTTRDRFRRSRLYLPGNEPKFFLNAGLHRPDGVILDLEDSVAPAEKDAARIMVRNALRVVDFYGAERMVRINQGERGLEDIDAVVPENVHVLLVPKTEGAEDVIRVAERVDAARAASGRTDPVYLMPIIESAMGVLNAYAIASATESVVAVAVGLEDYTADLGAERTREGQESVFARSQVVNAARAAGVQPIDSVFSDVGDEEGLRSAVRTSRAMGYDGMGCIHPRQIRVIHEELAPRPDVLERAKRVVQAFERAEAEGLGVVSLGTKMIDPPVVKRALRTVELATKMGILTEDWREGEGS